MNDPGGITESGLRKSSEGSSPDTGQHYVPFLDERGRAVSQIVLEYVVVFAISIMGLVTNVLVILVFVKQGFHESVAVSMTTVAVWDLIKSMCGVLECLTGVLSVADPAAAFTWANISVVSFNYLLGFSSYVTSVMAAYVAVERCLCVSIPLKVKWLLTPKVTLVACLVISVVVFGAFAVMFGIYDVTWEWSEDFNATVAIYRMSSFNIENQNALFKYYNISGIVWPLVAFIVIVVATVIIAYKLKQGSKFRAGQSSTNSSLPAASNSQSGQQQQQQKQQKQQHSLSRRDRQVVRMLLVIIAIYIVCLSPRIGLYLAKYFVYELYFLRAYHHLFMFVVYWLWIADFTNGSVNFFVFYAMSSSFRATFKEMVSRKTVSKKRALQ